MKKCILFAFLCFYSVSAWADRCVLNTQSIAQLALEQLKTATKVVYYCPTCLKDNHVRYINVSDLKIIQEDKRQIIQIEGTDIDLAYIYLPTDKVNVYRNLGYMVACADLKGSPVLEYLDVSNPYGIEELEKISMQLEQCQTDDCVERSYQDILQNYFENSDKTLKGFPSEQVILPEIISKAEVQKLLDEISHYYGISRF